jgi:PAS domain S-box-containing protein
LLQDSEKELMTNDATPNVTGPHERRQTLANYERRYEMLVASISDYAIYMLDTDGYVSSWNAGAERFKGYQAAEILGEHFSRFYTDEDRAGGLPARALATATREGRFEGEGWRMRKDGTRFFANVVIDPIRDAEGKLVGFAKITRDITERMKTLEALRESEQRFRLLVQGVTDYAIYMLSPEGIITNWNVGAQRIKGYTQDEAVGSNFRRFFTEEDRASGLPERALETAGREGRFESEGWRVRQDGTRFWASAVVDRIQDEQGHLIGFAKITRDITEKRKAAESLEQARDALFQSQKMEAVGQLTGGVAHDFNNLLAVLSSGVDILAVQLQNTGGNASNLRVLDSMRRAVDRGALLTQQLLSFARQQPLEAAPHQLNTLITSFEPVLRRACGPLVNFRIDLAPKLEAVMVDEARFEAALLNLVVNARDAMPDGGALFLETRSADLAEGQVPGLAAGSYVRVSVRDTGTGMAPEILARALEPFFTTKPPGKGTGLGLSQVYGFIKQSGGEVDIVTAPGQGTAISLYLPAAFDVEAAPPAEAARPDRVLIVEDDPLVMDLATELFHAMGYEVLSAGDGPEALRVLERDDAIGVMFSDVMMPNGMTGVELARTVRERYPDIKIILASGYPLPALRNEQQGLGDFVLLSKPYRLADLARHLRQPG